MRKIVIILMAAVVVTSVSAASSSKEEDHAMRIYAAPTLNLGVPDMEYYTFNTIDSTYDCNISGAHLCGKWRQKGDTIMCIPMYEFLVCRGDTIRMMELYLGFNRVKEFIVTPDRLEAYSWYFSEWDSIGWSPREMVPGRGPKRTLYRIK